MHAFLPPPSDLSHYWVHSFRVQIELPPPQPPPPPLFFNPSASGPGPHALKTPSSFIDFATYRRFLIHADDDLPFQSRQYSSPSKKGCKVCAHMLVNGIYPLVLVQSKLLLQGKSLTYTLIRTHTTLSNRRDRSITDNFQT